MKKCNTCNGRVAVDSAGLGERRNPIDFGKVTVDYRRGVLCDGGQCRQMTFAEKVAYLRHKARQGR